MILLKLKTYDFINYHFKELYFSKQYKKDSLIDCLLL